MKDYAGQRFGTFTALKSLGRYPGGYKWLCVCDCGLEREVFTQCLAQLRLRCKCASEKSVSNHPLYGVWRHMVDRCNNPANESYAGYGGRGIKVCERWAKFENFVVDMHPRPKGFSIDRINNDGDYEPSNCRWATTIEQNNNTRTNVVLSWQGKQMTIAQWARELGISRQTLHRRLTSGMSDNMVFHRGLLI